MAPIFIFLRKLYDSGHDRDIDLRVASAVLYCMVGQRRSAQDLVGFAEAVLELLQRGRFTSTYKYAVILSIIDLCLEGTTETGAPPEVLTTRQLSEKCIDLYWQHARAFRGELVLRQNSGGQAKIVTAICKFRETLEGDPSPAVARVRKPEGFERLLHEVERVLVTMPLPKLQRVGERIVPLIYEIAWDDEIKRHADELRRYQSHRDHDFDNRIHLLPGVGRKLVQLNGLLRPLLHREWASRVARLNSEWIEDSELEEFLFGASRLSPGRIRVDLADLQNGECFYCHGGLGRAKVHLDHFIPWSRYPDNGIHNFVVAHGRCNTSKRDHLAAVPHLRRWRGRLSEGKTLKALQVIAAERAWESDIDRTLGVARGIYYRLGQSSLLWLEKDQFEEANVAEITKILSVAAYGAEVTGPTAAHE